MLPLPGNAQVPAMVHYGVKDGLPSATVYKVLQDRKGFMWFCTDVGVAKFDGSRFVKFTSADGLGENEIIDMLEDSRGRIWFMGFNGSLSYYHKNSMHNARTDTMLSQIGAAGTIYSAFEDKQGRLWFSVYDGSYVLGGGKWKFLRRALNFNRHIINSTRFEGVIILGNDRYRGEAWVERNGKLHHYKMRYSQNMKGCNYRCADTSFLFTTASAVVWMKDTFQKELFPLPEALKKTVQHAMLLDRNGDIWIGVKGKLKLSGGSVSHFGFGLVLLGILISSSKKEILSYNTSGISADFGKISVAGRRICYNAFFVADAAINIYTYANFGFCFGN
ncbi:MAG: hypothetical protein EOO03_13600 [Chitinophagaceae bacterium]|nr:MAG: hypothetical protein EOO03_13600 [Chitinophagaceae bacterium]